MAARESSCQAAGDCEYWASSRTLCEGAAGGSSTCAYTANPEGCAATDLTTCANADLSSADEATSRTACTDAGACAYTAGVGPIAEACNAADGAKAKDTVARARKSKQDLSKLVLPALMPPAEPPAAGFSKL